ncbi:MAG: hypothetical protein WB441_13585 [Nocardioidaceae bacterium]
MAPLLRRWSAPVAASAAVAALLVGEHLLTRPVSGLGPGPGPDTEIAGLRPHPLPTLRPQRPGSVRVTGYRTTPTGISLFYLSADCGSTEPPIRVRETRRYILVTLAAIPADRLDRSCSEPRSSGAVEVALVRPLGGRLVTDLARGRALVSPVGALP